MPMSHGLTKLGGFWLTLFLDRLNNNMVAVGWLYWILNTLIFLACVQFLNVSIPTPVSTYLALLFNTSKFCASKIHLHALLAIPGWPSGIVQLLRGEVLLRSARTRGQTSSPLETSEVHVD